ncbi:tetratricopeptide repeat protein [Streptomyces sp. NBC_01262]|uniref:tetratricopeptide repeat protein n=1 Tax=Streptomyces sp. NBC_01262 TaxID=2903803 RepID=UPI002E3353EF|nr:tetratricopeptide repeat protein [Streptomyces sp. NBC_01262]
MVALSAAAAGWAKQWLDQQWKLRRDLPGSIVLHGHARGFPHVRDVADPVLIGVHRAETSAEHPQQSRADGLPRYIPREVDPELREAIRRGGLVILVGESTAGKSRAAFEGIRTQAPDHLLAVPSSREALAAVATSLSEVPRAVLWLDELERFLGPGGLTPALAAGLATKPGREMILLGTMRTAEYERFTSREPPAPGEQDRSAWLASRDVLRAAHTISLNRLWSPAELARAERFADDSRIARALGQAAAFGIAETLTAGPTLVRDWRNAWNVGTHPRAAALVAAAVDCRRAGLDAPAPHDLLQDLHVHYLEARGGHTLRPEPIDEAWAWALQPVHGASSLLIPAGSISDDPRYLAFDYLIDQPDHEPIPPETWNLLVARTDASHASRIASEAFWRVRTAFHAAVDSGAVANVYLQAQALADRRDYIQAIRILTAELDTSDQHQNPDAEWRGTLRHQIAFYHLQAGHIEQAEAAFLQLLAEAEEALAPEDEYLQVVRHNLGACTRRRGDLPGALAQFQHILTNREQHLGPAAVNTLATRGTIASIIGEMGDAAEALRLTRQILADEERALGPDHTNTLSTRHSLAGYLAETGDPGAAIDVLQALVPDLTRALGAEHPDVLDARWDIARYQARNGNKPAALRQFREVLADQERLLDAHDPRLEQARQEIEDLRTQGNEH